MRRASCCHSCSDEVSMELCNHTVGKDMPLFLIAGPCVIESESLAMHVATTMREICQRVGVLYVFKASYDKANRTSSTSFRGLGFEEGLRILQKIKTEVDVPVLTDVHE